MKNYIQGIDHVQVAAPVECEEEARDFYGNKIGMVEIPKPEELKKRGGCWFKCGNQEIHIGVERNFTPAKKAHPAFYVNEINEFKQTLIGVTIHAHQLKNPDYPQVSKNVILSKKLT
ncbi:hypothetical protein, partial [Bacillus cereus]|uniref:hypothetical protein n=1 Tax=Bacillus cereus TaxID=1396 RepID=UPI0020D27401